MERISKTAAPKAVRKQIMFVAKLKDAKQVVVTGDFTRWSKEQVRMAKGPNGEWQALLNLSPGEYQYRLIVDGEWRDHAEAQKRVANPYGTQNCILTVS